MVNIIWSKKATDDLKSIYKYIAKNSSFFAKKTRDELFEKTLILKDYPEIGKIIPEFELAHIRK